MIIDIKKVTWLIRSLPVTKFLQQGFDGWEKIKIIFLSQKVEISSAATIYQNVLKPKWISPTKLYWSHEGYCVDLLTQRFWVQF